MLAAAKGASASPCERRFRFPRSARLRRRAEFQRVYENGRRAGGRYMVVFALERDGAGPDGPRLGITASRRVGNAVVRARSKRRIRELFRTHVGAIGGRNVDLVVNARRGLAAAPWPELELEFRRTVKRLEDRLTSG